MKILLGSANAAKLAAMRATLARISTVDAAWEAAEVVARAVETDAPAMPLTDEEMMRGAQARAAAARELLKGEGERADFYIGLEGGFHSVKIDDRWHTFLRGWAYVTDGARGNFGASPSVAVPDLLVARVIEGRRELAEVIDEAAGERDIRNRQGAWGVLSCGLLTRSMSFEAALVAAFAPFYNPKLYP